MLCVVGSTAAISGFQSMAIATSNRKLWLGRITLVNVANQVATTIVTITLAWIFQSVWALAIGNVVGSLIGTILGHLALPWHRHKLHMERKAMGSLFRFGRWIFLTTLVGYIGGQGMRAIQGALVTTETLGYIAIAGTFSLAMSELCNRLVGSVGFPRLAMAAREQPGQLLDMLNRMRVRLLGFSIPILLALSLVSVPLIKLLYDPRYAIAGPLLAIMAINAAIAIVPTMYHTAFLAVGDSRTPLFLVTISTVMQVVGATVGYSVGGLEGMLIGMGCGGIGYYCAAAGIAGRAGWLSLRIDGPTLLLIVAGAWATYRVNF